MLAMRQSLSELGSRGSMVAVAVVEASTFYRGYGG